MTNFSASYKVRTYPADIQALKSHNANMARRGIPKGPVSWYINEWMAAVGIKTQAELGKLANWSKATTSQICNGKQDYSPAIIKAASEALGVEPFELLIPPERAMAFRRFYAEAKQVVETGADAAPTVVDLANHRAKKSA